MKSRGFCFTFNNYTEDDIERVDKVCQGANYAIWGKEVGKKTGTPHLQGYLYYRNARSQKRIIQLLKGAHITVADGTAEENKAYCSKGEDIHEYGQLPQQGKRSDLNELKKEIENGRTVEDITMENSMAFHQYGRTLQFIETIVMRKRHRTEMTQGIWYCGPTGSGKSHAAFEGFSNDTHYVKNTTHKWWDGYKQQHTVILNDFRGEIPYNYLLQLVDKWPMSVPIRGREDIPFTSKRLIITSSLRPEEVYHNRHRSDGIGQLLRRFEVISATQRWSEGNNVTSVPPPLANETFEENEEEEYQ